MTTRPMIANVLIPAALAASFLAPLAAAQADSGARHPEDAAVLPTIGLSMDALEEARQSLILDEPGDGRTWGRSASWKASFGPEGFTFIPFFGSNAPKNLPVRFDLETVRLSGEEIPLSSRERSRVGATVTLERSSVREVYHLDQRSVEQTFVFDSLPHAGDLTLELDVTTELAPSTRPDGSLEFGSPYGHVHYGTATAIDASGKALSLTQTLENGVLRIHVPESFVASAAFPLTIDPILSTFSFGAGPRDVLDVDVAYEGNNSTYQIVFSERQSAFDSDILAISYNAALGVLLNASAIDVTSTSWVAPANASAYQEQQFLCVGLRGTGIGNRAVWGRTRDSGTNAAGPQFAISGLGADSVDVGGKGNDIISSFDYMVVWQEADVINQDFDIIAQAVRGDSTLPNGRINVDGDAGDFDTNPSISKSSGNPDTQNDDNEYMIVWEREVGADNRNLRAQVMEYTGNMNGHSQFNAYTFSDSIDPDVSSVSSNPFNVQERHWVIAFERRTGADYDIFTVVATDGNADNARSIQTMQNLEQDLDHRDPVIGYDSEDHLILYQTESPAGDRSVHLTAVNVVRDGSELRTGVALRRETLALSEGAPASFGLATHWDGGGPFSSNEPGDAVAVWTVRNAASDDYDPSGAVVAEVSIYNVGSQYCEAAVNSTGASAFINMGGLDFSSSGIYRLTASEMPLNSFGHFLVSNQSGFVVNPGGSQGNLCLQGSVGRFNRPGEIMNSGAIGSFSLDFNASDMPSPTGTVSAMPGET
ncbi:MAG: hypothetical protein AAGG01_01640, partial [Planctomycetota bacterium]